MCTVPKPKVQAAAATPVPVAPPAPPPPQQVAQTLNDAPAEKEVEARRKAARSAGGNIRRLRIPLNAQAAPASAGGLAVPSR